MESHVERNNGHFDKELIFPTYQDVEISEQVEQSPSHSPISLIAGPSSGGCSVMRKRKYSTSGTSEISSSSELSSSSGVSTPSDEGADDNDNTIDFLGEESNCALEQAADKREEIGVDDETVEKSFGFKFNEQDGYFYCLKCQKRFLIKHRMKKHLYIKSGYHTQFCANCGFKAYGYADAIRHKKVCTAQFVKMVKLTLFEEIVENILNAVFKVRRKYFQKASLAKKRNAMKPSPLGVTPLKKAKKKKDSIKRATAAAKPLDSINKKVDGQRPSLDEPSVLKSENHFPADDDDVFLLYDENMIVVPGIMDRVDMVDEGDDEEKEEGADLHANNAPKPERNAIGSEGNTIGNTQGRRSLIWRRNGDGCGHYFSSQESPSSPSSVASYSSSQSSPSIYIYEVVSFGESSVGFSRGSPGSSASKPSGPSGVILHPGTSAFERGGLNSIPTAQQAVVPTTMIKVKPTLVTLMAASGKSVVEKALFQCNDCNLIYGNLPTLTTHMVNMHNLRRQSKVKVKAEMQPLPPPPPSPPQPQLPFSSSFSIGSWQRRLAVVSPIVREEDGSAAASFPRQNRGLSNFTPKEDCKHCAKRNADVAHIRQCFIRYSCPYCLHCTHDDMKVVVEHMIMVHNDLWKYGVKIFSKLLVTTSIHRKIRINEAQWKNAIKHFNIPFLDYLLQIEKKHNVANKVMEMEIIKEREISAAMAMASSSSTVQAAAPQTMECLVDLTFED